MLRLPAHRPLTVALIASGSLLAGSKAAVAAPAYVPGEVLVRYGPGVDRAARLDTQRATRTGRPEAFAPRSRTLRIRGGATVAETVRALRRRPEVASASPNWIARSSAFIPNDPGAAGVPGGWVGLQWNFVGEYGVRAPEAWDTLIRAGRPGGSGVTVAVLDTGVAYADARRFRRSPDLSGSRLRRGYDFVASDPYPDDHNGHGTHVASTVAESADNEIGLVGLAYGARIMPVRVLDSRGEGNAADIARGIRFAARNGAQVINLSFEFGSEVRQASIPEVLAALRYARTKGSLVVGASGNTGGPECRLPCPLLVRRGGGRHDGARLPGRVLQSGQGAGPRRSGRRARCSGSGGPPLPPAGAAGTRHLPGDLQGVRAALRDPRGIRGNLNGRPARLGRRRPGDRLARPWAESLATEARGAPRGDRSRPRARRARLALRRRAAGRRAGHRAVDTAP
jgi:hypothetical protein